MIGRVVKLKTKTRIFPACIGIILIESVPCRTLAAWQSACPQLNSPHNSIQMIEVPQHLEFFSTVQIRVVDIDDDDRYVFEKWIQIEQSQQFIKGRQLKVRQNHGGMSLRRNLNGLFCGGRCNYQMTFFTNPGGHIRLKLKIVFHDQDCSMALLIKRKTSFQRD